jgi:hypothetical protein
MLVSITILPVGTSAVDATTTVRSGEVQVAPTIGDLRRYEAVRDAYV